MLTSLAAAADGALEPVESEVGEKVPTDRAPRRPSRVHELLGSDEMAGVVVHVSDAGFRRAIAAGGMAALRLRTLLRLPDGDPTRGREVVARLGATRTTPLTLGRVEVASVGGAPPWRGRPLASAATTPIPGLSLWPSLRSLRRQAASVRSRRKLRSRPSCRSATRRTISVGPLSATHPLIRDRAPVPRPALQNAWFDVSIGEPLVPSGL